MTDDSVRHVKSTSQRSGRVLSRAAMLLVLVGFGPCADQPQSQASPAQSAPVNAPSPMPKPNPPTAPPALPSEPLAAVAQLVDRIAALSELSKDAIERVVGVQLAHLANASAAEQYYEAKLANGPFARIEVRLSNPAQQKFALVMLDARADLRLPLTAFQSSGRVRPGMSLDVNPDVPPEGTTTFTDTRDHQKLHYEFTTNSQQFKSVVIERRPGQ